MFQHRGHRLSEFAGPPWSVLWHYVSPLSERKNKRILTLLFLDCGRGFGSLALERSTAMTPYGKTAQSAIAAMSRLAEAYAEKRSLSSMDIARDRHLAQPLIAKLLTMLSQAGLVVGERGPGGGYRLARTPRKISLLDIVSVFERVENRTVCPFGPDWCGNQDPCPLHDAYMQFNEQFDSFLRQTNLDVFAPRTPAPGIKNKGKRKGKMAVK